MKRYLFLLIIIPILVIGISAAATAADLSNILSGKIILQVESSGEAYYVNPDDKIAYYLGRPDDAFNIMRAFGLGIKHDELLLYLSSSFPSRLSGKILLDVELNGEAYYIFPDDMKGYYLGRPTDAFNVMRNKGLGISNANLAKLETYNKSTTYVEESSLNYVIVDTGQRSCYNLDSKINCPNETENYYGQDANYDGNQASYTDNNNGTVTDNNTGLMWVKAVGNKMSYQEAINGVNSFNLAGYNDWRVPTIKELYSLMDFNGIDPTDMNADPNTLTPFINNNYFNFEYGDTSDGSRVIDSQWVTSNKYVSTVMNNQECFFGVNFADGRIKCYPTADNGHNQGYFVRYVRGNSYGDNKFVDKGSVIEDEATGLTWQKNDSGYGMYWDDALNYCEDLSLGSYSDWRLPNAKELQSIVDYNRSPDTTNSPAINEKFNSTSFTNEAGKKDWGFYWSSTTHLNDLSVSPSAYVSFGRALGYMSEFGGWVDVHGAGAQRSDNKEGNPSDYPTGHGPQGDAKRFYNYVRCVRGETSVATNTETVSGTTQNPTNNTSVKTPPSEAIEACYGKSQNDSCYFSGAQGIISGSCKTPPGSSLACVP